MEKLPSETVSEILSRLPADSLSESRKVCQSWSNTIYDRCFLTSHQHQLGQNQNSGLSLVLLLQKDNKTGCQLYYAEYDPYMPECYKHTKINHPPFTNWHNNHTIVGSCNGLICISKHFIKDPVYVCNPMTQECIYLHSYTRKEYCRGSMVSGFGFCSTTSEYKVVRMLYRSRAGHAVDQSFLGKVQVFTLGKDTKWRRKGKSPYLLNSQKSGVLVNGALHWLTEKCCCMDYITETSHKIVAFDLAEEEFRIVVLPLCLGLGNAYDMTELGGCLCIKVNFRDGRNEIWKMKDYTTQKWTKEYTIEAKRDRPMDYVYTPVAVTRHGELLLWEEDVWNGYSRTLLSYDQKIEDLGEIENYGKVDRRDAVTYIKSLVSLKAIGESPMKMGEEMESQKIVGERKRKRSKIE